MIFINDFHFHIRFHIFFAPYMKVYWRLRYLSWSLRSRKFLTAICKWDYCSNNLSPVWLKLLQCMGNITWGPDCRSWFSSSREEVMTPYPFFPKCVRSDASLRLSPLFKQISFLENNFDAILVRNTDTLRRTIPGDKYEYKINRINAWITTNMKLIISKTASVNWNL